MPKAAAASATPPDKVTLNFYLPHAIEFQGQKVRGRAAAAPHAVPCRALLPPGRAPGWRRRRRAPASPQVDQVSIPATTGEFGVLPGHVATVAQLKPGVLAVHLETDKNVKKARARPAPPRPQRRLPRRRGCARRAAPLAPAGRRTRASARRQP